MPFSTTILAKNVRMKNICLSASSELIRVCTPQPNLNLRQIVINLVDTIHTRAHFLPSPKQPVMVILLQRETFTLIIYWSKQTNFSTLAYCTFLYTLHANAMSHRPSTNTYPKLQKQHIRLYTCFYTNKPSRNFI